MKKKTFGRLIFVLALTLTLLLIVGCKSADNGPELIGPEPGGSETNNGSEDPAGSDNGSSSEADPLVAAQQA